MHGLWGMGDLWVIPAYQLGGSTKLWVTGGYGFWQVWVMTGSSVAVFLAHI